jgi:hypothetical protein
MQNNFNNLLVATSRRFLAIISLCGLLLGSSTVAVCQTCPINTTNLLSSQQLGSIFPSATISWGSVITPNQYHVYLEVQRLGGYASLANLYIQGTAVHPYDFNVPLQLNSTTLYRIRVVPMCNGNEVNASGSTPLTQLINFSLKTEGTITNNVTLRIIAPKSEGLCPENSASLPPTGIARFKVLSAKTNTLIVHGIYALISSATSSISPANQVLTGYCFGEKNTVAISPLAGGSVNGANTTTNRGITILSSLPGAASTPVTFDGFLADLSTVISKLESGNYGTYLGTTIQFDPNLTGLPQPVIVGPWNAPSGPYASSTNSSTRQIQIMDKIRDMCIASNSLYNNYYIYVESDAASILQSNPGFTRLINPNTGEEPVVLSPTTISPNPFTQSCSLK